MLHLCWLGTWKRALPMRAVWLDTVECPSTSQSSAAIPTDCAKLMNITKSNGLMPKIESYVSLNHTLEKLI